jgi:hypothetical protein
MEMIMKLLVIVLFLLHSSFTYCCETNDWSKPEWLEKSGSAYYGRIVSIVLDEVYSAENLPEPLTNNLNELRNLSSSTDRVIEVIVLKTIKGKALQRIKAEISWCGGGETGFLEYITIYNSNGFWHVIPDIEPEKLNEPDPLILK